MKGANKYICKHLFVGGSESCLSGCFRLFAQKFWEVVGLFCHSLDCRLSGGNTQEVMRTHKTNCCNNLNYLHSPVAGMQEDLTCSFMPDKSTHLVKTSLNFGLTQKQ